MAKLEDLGQVFSTDLLIVGGGIAGVIAACKAREDCPDADVLVVDMATIGYAGKAPKTGGVLAVWRPEDNPEKFVEWHVTKVGNYLNDQKLLEKYVRDAYASMEKLAEWGVTIGKDAEGHYSIGKNPLAPSDESIVQVSLDMMLPLRAKARKMGVKMLNKVYVARLLTKDNRVVGAVGFNIVDGKFCIFKAKETMLATGDCAYKVKRFWRAAAGTGIVAAYWAGAEMRNPEFGNLYGHIVAKDVDGGLQYLPQQVVNASGERLLNKYVTQPGPWGYPQSMEFLLGWDKEVREGRGPIYGDVTIPREQPPPASPIYPPTVRPAKSNEWSENLADKIKKYWHPASPTKHELEIYLHGEQSCVKVDHEMKTTVPGLWAIGDASYAGAALAGAVCAPPGITQSCGLGFAFLSAMWAGPSAARATQGRPLIEPEYEQVKQFKEEIFAPLQREKGVSPTEIIDDIQSVVCPTKYNLRRKEDRLKEALSKVKAAEQKLRTVKAKDLHYLMKCHEATAMAVCAEMMFKAALMRTESRGEHYREDYPKRDDKNWLKWIIIKQEKGNMVLSTEPVPIDKYRIKP